MPGVKSILFSRRLRRPGPTPVVLLCFLLLCHSLWSQQVAPTADSLYWHAFVPQYKNLSPDKLHIPGYGKMSINVALHTSDGVYWLGTSNNGLYRWNGSHYQHFGFHPTDTASLPSNHVLSLSEALPGQLWIVTNNGICRLHLQSMQLTSYFFKSAGHPELTTACVSTGAGRIYVGTRQGLAKVDTATGAIELCPQRYHAKVHGKALAAPGQYPPEINGLTSDGQNNLWATLKIKKNGLLGKWHEESGQWETFWPVYTKQSRHEYLTELRNPWYDALTQSLMMGTAGNGLFSFHLVAQRWTQRRYLPYASDSLHFDHVYWVTRLQAQRYMVSTYEGLVEWDAANGSFIRLDDGKVPLFSQQKALATDRRGGLLLVHRGQSLLWIRSPPAEQIEEDLFGKETTQLTTLHKAWDGSVLASGFLETKNSRMVKLLHRTAGGALYTEELSVGNKKLTDRIDQLYLARNGDVYAWTAVGKMMVMQKGAKHFVIQPFTGPQKRIFASDLFTSGDSAFYVSSNNGNSPGLWKIDPRNARVARLVSTPIYALTQVSAHTLLCRISSHQFGSFDLRTALFTPLTTVNNAIRLRRPLLLEGKALSIDGWLYFPSPQGLVRGKIVGQTLETELLHSSSSVLDLIAIDRQTLLFTTAQQLVWYDLEANKTLKSRPLGAFGRKGKLWVADSMVINESFQAFYLRQRTYTGAAPIRILRSGVFSTQQLYAPDESRLYDSLIERQPGENFFSIAYSSDAYADPDQTLYRYRLEGYDRGWVEAGFHTSASYAALPPGTYRFWVQVSGEDGSWSTPQLLHRITLLPAWYQTFGVRIGFGLLLLGALAMLVRTFILRKRMQLERKDAQLKSIQAEYEQERFRLESISLRAQMNPHFLFNVLNSINRYILMEKAEEASQYLIKFSRLVRKVLENSEAPRVSLGSDLDALEMYIQLEQMRMRGGFDYAIEIEPDIDLQQMQVPPLLLQPYVENAIWHGLTPKKGVNKTVRIRVQKLSDALISIAIEDNGVGRQFGLENVQTTLPLRKSLGTNLTQSRLELLQKTSNTTAGVVIEDLSNKADGSATGTRVVVTLYVPAKTASETGA